MATFLSFGVFFFFGKRVGKRLREARDEQTEAAKASSPLLFFSSSLSFNSPLRCQQSGGAFRGSSAGWKARSPRPECHRRSPRKLLLRRQMGDEESASASAASTLAVVERRGGEELAAAPLSSPSSLSTPACCCCYCCAPSPSPRLRGESSCFPKRRKRLRKETGSD